MWCFSFYVSPLGSLLLRSSGAASSSRALALHHQRIMSQRSSCTFRLGRRSTLRAVDFFLTFSPLLLSPFGSHSPLCSVCACLSFSLSFTLADSCCISLPISLSLGDSLLSLLLTLFPTLLAVSLGFSVAVSLS